MKKLMLMVVAALVSAVSVAAQCKGVTQKGERCKRDAAEGSSYCIGHARDGVSGENVSGEKRLKD